MKIKVCFFPLWQEKNPYQKLLIEQLLKLGIEMQEATKKSILFRGRRQVDILHLHWLHPYFLAAKRREVLFNIVKFSIFLFFSRLRGVKIIWTAHNLKNHENQNLWLERVGTIIVTRLCHAIIAHCEAAKDEVIKTFKIANKDKILVIPHGNYIDYYENKIDRESARKILDIPSSNLVLLFLGLIRPYKGVLELIETFQQVRQDGTQLLIAGKVLHNPKLEEQIQQKVAKTEGVKLIADFIPDEQIQVYMNACDVVVFPYRDILTSGGVLLAMSFDRACIVPHRGCIGEVLDDAGAFLYSPDMEDGLLQAIREAIKQHSALQQMGKHNRQLAQKYSWDRIGEMTLEVYQSCLRI